MWPLNPALGRFVWTRHGSMLSSVVRQDSGTCVVPCADLSTALTQYTLGPLLPWWHNLPCQICFCAVSEQKHAGSMVMLLVQV